VWLAFMVSRHLVLRQASKSISEDMACYDAEWSKLSNIADQASGLRNIEDVTARLNAIKIRPMQLLAPPSKHRTTSASASSSIPPPAFLPIASDNQLTWIRSLIGLMGNLASGASTAEKLCSSVDTLFMQSHLIQPIFHAKVQQIAIAAPGKFFTRVHNGTQDHINFVEARAWDGAGSLKSADRAIEKLVRCYQGNAALLLDVVRQCIVFENVQDMLKALHTIEGDDEIQVVRIKNRMSAEYSSKESGGKISFASSHHYNLCGMNLVSRSCAHTHTHTHTHTFLCAVCMCMCVCLTCLRVTIIDGISFRVCVCARARRSLCLFIFL
jgi:hypothetical protein